MHQICALRKRAIAETPVIRAKTSNYTYILQTKRVLAARGMGSVAVGLVDVDHDHPEGPTTQPEGPEDEDDGLPDDPYIDPNA